MRPQSCEEKSELSRNRNFLKTLAALDGHKFSVRRPEALARSEPLTKEKDESGAHSVKTSHEALLDRSLRFQTDSFFFSSLLKSQKLFLVVLILLEVLFVLLGCQERGKVDI